uniref:Jacalin-type lectin domain-containing protein n=1 Tax=Oryza punctata TaxID=4537 RepID=A0A0E0KYD1_ORYPU
MVDLPDDRPLRSTYLVESRSELCLVVVFFQGFDARYWIGVNFIGAIEQILTRREMEGLAKIGPWGGNGGDPQDIVLAAGAAPPHRLVRIEVRSGGAIDALSFTYAAIDGTEHAVGPWGFSGGKNHKVKLGEAEVVTEISGTLGPWGGHAGIVVRSLSFVTSAGKTHGPFGEKVGGAAAAFRVPVKGGGRVVGFFARSGWLLDAVGVYVHP